MNFFSHVLIRIQIRLIYCNWLTCVLNLLIYRFYLLLLSPIPFFSYNLFVEETGWFILQNFLQCLFCRLCLLHCLKYLSNSLYFLEIDQARGLIRCWFDIFWKKYFRDIFVSAHWDVCILLCPFFCYKQLLMTID